MSLSPGNRFVVGVNKGWFGGKYDHDIGYNQFSIGRLYRTNIPNPSLEDIPNPSLPDPNPEVPYLSSHQEEVVNFFERLQTEHRNVSVLRVWAFERFEGLRFDSNGYVIGIDDEFLSNLSMLFDTAKSFGIKIYLCLLDTWSIYSEPTLDIIQGGKQEHYLQLQNTWIKIIRMLVRDDAARDKFFHTALHPLLEHDSIRQNLFAIDLMNEPEGLVSKDPQIKITDIKNYIITSSNYIRSLEPSIKVSCGFQHFSTIKNIAKELDRYLDFFDFHEYNRDGNLDHNSITQMTTKPCIVGECGYPVSDLGESANDANEAKIVKTIRQFLENANSNGFAGGIAWLEDYSNKDEILLKIKEFANKNPIIIEAKKQGCFIATAAMGSELHPHVQMLREYRDSVILKSGYKEQFLRILNVYYSFSPAVADLMEKNVFAKSLIKYWIVYPAVLSIKILIKLIGK